MVLAMIVVSQVVVVVVMEVQTLKGVPVSRFADFQQEDELMRGRLRRKLGVLILKVHFSLLLVR